MLNIVTSKEKYCSLATYLTILLIKVTLDELISDSTSTDEIR